MDFKDFGCKSEEESMRLMAELRFAKLLGLIDDDSLEALERRRILKNKECEEGMLQGLPVYGLTCYSREAYAEYELTWHRLSFVSCTDDIKKRYSYDEISMEDKRKFYHENARLFTRYLGDFFSFEEVETVIEKRLREMEYDRNVCKLLC